MYGCATLFICELFATCHPEVNVNKVCVCVWPRFPVVAILNKGSYTSRQVHAIKTGDGAKGLMKKVAAYEVGY